MSIKSLVAQGGLIRRGERGERVKLVQAGLHAAGHNIAVDGDFGPATEATVKDFQNGHGLLADGLVGAKTAAALDHALDEDTGLVDRDTPAPPETRPQVWPRQTGVSAFYGPVGKHQTTLVLPYPMRITWDKAKLITRFSVHEKVHDSARRCFERIADAYAPELRAEIGLDLFGGCLNVRRMRGGSAWSMHSWGIAIDFDPERNQLRWGRDRARLAKPDCETFWRIWEDEGWLSLGRARNYDWMHVQAARL